MNYSAIVAICLLTVCGCAYMQRKKHDEEK